MTGVGSARGQILWPWFVMGFHSRSHPSPPCKWRRQQAVVCVDKQSKLLYILRLA